MARFDLKAEEIDRLTAIIKEYPNDAEKKINEVLHGEAGEWIEKSIINLLPESNRNWKGKKKSAKMGKPFKKETEKNLGVTVRTKYDYHYLYFPDDGTTTKKHVGEKEFMYKGAESQQTKIIDRIIQDLVQTMEGE